MPHIGKPPPPRVMLRLWNTSFWVIALIGLTTSVSAELGPRGIRVNLLCPGIIDTPMHHRGRLLFGDAIYDNILASRVHALLASLMVFSFRLSTAVLDPRKSVGRYASGGVA